MSDEEVQVGLTDAQILKNIWLHFWGTTSHKIEVIKEVAGFSYELFVRALKHDLSKYTPDEARGFIQVIHKLSEMEYGTDEYRELLASIRPSIKIHYSKNKHHPEHWDNGIEDMRLLDIVEMFLDWRAATKRHETGDIVESVGLNVGRFGITGVLAKILMNEARIKK